ncbi:unnamed protein product [Caenorhabditis brenneri]
MRNDLSYEKKPGSFETCQNNILWLCNDLLRRLSRIVLLVQIPPAHRKVRCQLYGTLQHNTNYEETDAAARTLIIVLNFIIFCPKKKK